MPKEEMRKTQPFGTPACPGTAADRMIERHFEFDAEGIVTTCVMTADIDLASLSDLPPVAVSDAHSTTSAGPHHPYGSAARGTWRFGVMSCGIPSDAPDVLKRIASKHDAILSNFTVIGSHTNEDNAISSNLYGSLAVPEPISTGNDGLGNRGKKR